MNRNLILMTAAIACSFASSARADLVTDWNATLCYAAETVTTKHNPGVPTRAMAMMNGAIYDIFQSVERTHEPFLVNTRAPAGASVDAAVSQAAYRVLSDMYPEIQGYLNTTKTTRLGAITDGPEKEAGIKLGNYIAKKYIDSHQNDGWTLPDEYSPIVGPGHWSTDPMLDPVIQKGWGSDWGSVVPWAIPSPDHFDSTTPFTIADMNTQRYTDAFDEVKRWGSRVSNDRTDDQTEIGLFWAYDRPGTGAPPVLFIENMVEIGEAVGNTPEDNARMFAMASVSLADAIISCWDTKYEVDLWRPITGIRNADDDGNPNTIEDEDWEYLGAPGDDHAGADDDFTPPFPSYISGHATMGGAIFKTLELFYGTNSFAEADDSIGNDPVTSNYTLHSTEEGGGDVRSYVRFTQEGALGPGMENSPQGENSMSRIYLGVHWRIDQEDGQALGDAVAEYVAGNFFSTVPEPSSFILALMCIASLSLPRRRQNG